MKKLFLIPLMAMLCTVMAWATDVANKTELQNALNAGGNITLTDNIALGNSKVIMTSGTVVLDLNGHNLTGTLANYGTDKGVLNVSGGNLTINATGGGNIDNTGSNGCGIVTTGSAKVTINGGTFHGYEAIYAAGGEVIVNGGAFSSTSDNCIWLAGESGAKVTVNGGTFVGGWMCFQVDKGTELLINGGSFTKGDGTIYPGGTITVKGGTFDENPWKYVSVPYYVGKVDELFQVAHIGSNVAVADFVAYPSLAAAVSGASDGAAISLFANDNNSIIVSKNAVIETNGFTANGVTADDGYGKFVVDGNIIISNNALVTFLQGNESAKTLDANISFAQKLVVNGTKELTIADDVTISATYVKDACIVVPNGAKLTIYGNGTIAGDRDLIRVEKGGELIIGHADKSDCLKMTTTLWSTVNYAVNNYGKTTINNAEVHAASAALNTYGVMDVNGGYYTAEAYYPNHRYAVTADDGSQLTIKNSRVFGIHGALACQGSAGANIGGSARIENCELVATHTPYLTKKNTTSIHYGIYSASGGIVSVYNSKMRSTQQARAIHIGNNDAWNTFGLVYVYEGCMVRAIAGTGKKNGNPSAKTTAEENRIWVQQRSETDKEILFPISVDPSSQWYTAAKTGGEAPLPAGYKWKQIIKEGEPTEDQVLDAAAYDEGYRWITVSTATATQEASDDPSATIPWQQSSTWDASAESSSTDDVPAATTAVTIPEGKTVVISNDPAKNNNMTEAVAEQVILGGEGASLTVQDGTSLNVTNGVNIADGAKLVIDAGAKVIVGEGGVVTANEEAIEIKTSEQKYGVFMIAPTVTENTHPMATVQMKSKAYKKADGTYVWQRFGVPSYMEGVTRGDILYDHVAAPTSVLKLDYENHSWTSMNNDDTFVPFRCYELTTTATTPGEVYTFNCPLMGNGNAELVIEGDWNYYANSYSAPIDIATLLQNYVDNVTSVQATVYLYRASDNWWLPINMFAIDENEIPDSMKVIRPMQAFIFQRWQGGENPTVNYANEVYNPIVNPASAPRRTAMQNTTKVTINLTTANGKTDYVRLVEGTNFSEDFDNGYDAVKYMNADAFNFYAPTMDGNMVYLATNNLGGQLLSLNTKEETSFTMTFSGVRGKVYTIKDMLTGTETLMQEGNTYCFSTNDNATIDGRFQIINRQEMPTGMESVQDGTVGSKGIYTIMGQYLGETTEWNNLPAGIYVVDGVKMVK